jgi:galactokinase
LKRFAELLNQMQQEQKERYELENEDTPWICEEQLRQSGIDFKELMSGD